MLLYHDMAVVRLNRDFRSQLMIFLNKYIWVLLCVSLLYVTAGIMGVCVCWQIQTDGNLQYIGGTFDHTSFFYRFGELLLQQSLFYAVIFLCSLCVYTAPGTVLIAGCASFIQGYVLSLLIMEWLSGLIDGIVPCTYAAAQLLFVMPLLLGCVMGAAAAGKAGFVYRCKMLSVHQICWLAVQFFCIWTMSIPSALTGAVVAQLYVG